MSYENEPSPFQSRWRTVKRNQYGDNTLLSNPLYVKEPPSFSPQSRPPVFIGILLVVFLIGSILWGMKQREKRLNEEAFQVRVASIEQKIHESENLANINPEASRTLFSQAQSEIAQLADGSHPEKVEELKNEIQKLQVEVLGERPVDVSLYVDLSLLSDGFRTSEMSIDGQNLYILDREHKKIAKVSLSSKRAEIVAGPNEIDEISALSSYADNLYGLSDRGIQEIVSERIVIRDEWRDALLYSYASNIYVLDKESSEIYRYTRVPGGFSEKTRWMNDDIRAPLSDSRAWVIDGSIWILKRDNTILRFTNGTYWQFTPQGVFPLLSSIDAIYTSDQEENLYILDSTGERVVVLSKQGEFITQYNSGQLKEAKFVLSREQNNTLFVITESKVYAIEME